MTGQCYIQNWKEAKDLTLRWFGFLGSCFENVIIQIFSWYLIYEWWNYREIMSLIGKQSYGLLWSKYDFIETYFF